MSGDYNASFVGFAPANAPVLSMIVVIERPQTTIYGGSVAAPIFQEVMSYALHHYNIPSNGTMVKPLKGAGAKHRIGRDLMQLGDVLDDFSLDVLTSSIEIDNVEIDSRLCVPGTLFFALDGTATRGATLRG
jgi:hypothetical protein